MRCRSLVGRHVRLPVPTVLFKVNPTDKRLSDPDRKLIHSLVASFLTSRVMKADRDDWWKLKRVLQYLQGTLDLPMTLSIDELSIVKTWADAAFGVHKDMRGHTGGTIVMGKGTFFASDSVYG